MRGTLQKGEHPPRRARETAVVHEYADEKYLLDLARGGNKAAYGELYRRHSKRVYQVVFRMTRNHEDTEDVLQDAMLKAFINLDGFEGRSAFSTWLTRIAINGVLMMRRKRMTHRESPIEGVGGSDGIQIRDKAPDAEEQVLGGEKVYRVHRAIEGLPLVLRVPLLRQLEEDLPVKDLADRLGLSVSATKSRLSRARTRVLETVMKPCHRSGA